MYWTIHLQGGPQRVNHAAVVVDKEIYSFGGYCSSEGYEVTGKIDVHILNTDSLRWKPVSYVIDDPRMIPFKRYGHTVVAYNRKIYLWGGRNDQHASAVLYCFHVDGYRWTLPSVTGEIPKAVDGHSACIIGDYMYVFGGYEEEGERFGDHVHRLNLKTMVWEKVKTNGATPLCRDFHSASVIGSRMYIFGGRGTAGTTEQQLRFEVYCNKIMYLNTSTMTWIIPKTKGTAPFGRRSHSAVVYNDEIYIFGGFNSLMQKHFGDIWKYSPETSTWSIVKCMGKYPCPRRRHCSCVVGDMMIVFGGTSPNGGDEPASAYSAIAHINLIDFEELDGYQKLIDHSDLHILEFFPTLKRLCLLKIIACRLDSSILPRSIRKEISYMTTDNSINTECVYVRRDFGVFPNSA